VLYYLLTFLETTVKFTAVMCEIYYLLLQLDRFLSWLEKTIHIASTLQHHLVCNT